MRLLNVDSFELVDFLDDKRPPYVAASHRWLEGEATYQDIRDRRNTDNEGYHKVKAFAEYIRESICHIKWLWIDTCCINKDSAAELSESINSMFDWYREADLCLAYLADVTAVNDQSAFEESGWFKRGWTLQELLAPRLVVFVASDWRVIGHKGDLKSSSDHVLVGPALENTIAGVTGIPEEVLQDYDASYALSTEDKLQWIEGRNTTRPEDMSYALYGILGVTLGANYGERFEGARQRLLAAIHQRDNLAMQEAEQLRTITEWLSPADPWTNHETARHSHESHTGTWLLHDKKYLAWKSGLSRCLWMHGKAGCGKTILCSTAVEDIRIHCESRNNTGHAIFYFSFSDTRKQTCPSLIASLVVQLCWKSPGVSMLRKVYEHSGRRQPYLSELRKTLDCSIASYDEVFVHLDGLDECPDGNGVRQHVLDGIEELLGEAPNVRVLVTSRDLPDIRCCMETLGSETLSIKARTVEADIAKYISTRLMRDRKLSRLDLATQTLIKETLLAKADGMFRWVYCQLQELSKSKSTRPKSVKAALLALPKTLDDAYERMLTNIDEDDRAQALTLLRWLAYAGKALSLSELAEAIIVDPTDDPTTGGIVEVDNRSDWRDTLEILASFVTVAGRYDIDSESEREDPDDCDDGDSETRLLHQMGIGTKVRLAHFSVKEYLESSRILEGDASEFHLSEARDSDFLTQSCLVYLEYYSESSQETSTEEDLTTFPLLKYAAKYWYRDPSLQKSASSARVMSLLASEDRKQDLLLVHAPDDTFKTRFEPCARGVGDAMYYASLLGLQTTVHELLEAGANASGRSGRHGNALQAACFEGHKEVVQMLIHEGAYINTQTEAYGNALHAAANGGHEDIVLLLFGIGANVNTTKDSPGSALQAASLLDSESIVKILLANGADVDANRGTWGTALQAASTYGYESIMRLLLAHGADVNAEGSHNGNALQGASIYNHEDVIEMLLACGADVNAGGGSYGNALIAASSTGREDNVRVLLAHGVDVNAQGGLYGNALSAASQYGREDVVKILLAHDADVNAQGGIHDNALLGACIGSWTVNVQIVRLLLASGADVNAFGDSSKDYALNAAARGRNLEVVQMLLAKGADVNPEGETALHAASRIGHEDMVRVLLAKGADVNALSGKEYFYETALQRATAFGHEKVVEILLANGAKVDDEPGYFGNALQLAASGGEERIVEMLLANGADVNADGATPFGNALFQASHSGHKRIVEILVAHGAKRLSRRNSAP